MANARMISRDFFSSADLIDQPYWAQVLFAGMIVLADDAGIVRADPLYLRNACLSPNKHRRCPDLCSISAVLDAFTARRMLDPCKLEGVSCYKITNFTRFQRLKRREGKRREEEENTSEALALEDVRGGGDSSTAMEDHYDPRKREVGRWLKEVVGVIDQAKVSEIARTGISKEDFPAWEVFAKERGLPDTRSFLRSHKNPSTIMRQETRRERDDRERRARAEQIANEMFNGSKP